MNKIIYKNLKNFLEDFLAKSFLKNEYTNKCIFED